MSHLSDLKRIKGNLEDQIRDINDLISMAETAYKPDYWWIKK